MYLRAVFLACVLDSVVSHDCGLHEDWAIRYGWNSVPSFAVLVSNGSCVCPGGFDGRHVGDGSGLTNLAAQPDIATLYEQLAAVQSRVSELASGSPTRQAGVDGVRPNSGGVLYSPCFYDADCNQTANLRCGGPHQRCLGVVNASCAIDAQCLAGFMCSAGRCVYNLGHETQPGLSCLHIKQRLPDSPSGVYYIGASVGTAVPLWCDMTIDGGGWTQVWLQDPAVKYFSPSIPYLAGTVSLVSSSLRMMFAYANQNNSLSNAWTFATPPPFWTATPMAAGPCVYAMITATSVQTGTSVTTFLLSSTSSWSTSDCDGDCVGSWGIVCLKTPGTAPGTVGGYDSFPFFSGFNANVFPQYCAESSQAYSAATCSASRKFAILVRGTDAPGSAALPVASCSQLRQLRPDAPSGSYLIGASIGSAVELWCEMLVDGGGWTRVYLQGTSDLASASIPYLPGTSSVLTDSSDMMFAWSNSYGTLSSPWKFPVPPIFRGATPMAAGNCSVSVFSA
eukprot:TRINITY_DN1537_c0_g1_i1.p1 TRINITY_DN1537_c0_g1~~TRINITY_DN1537_c0_g1_i1.p1  ORF type:complete len:507 (-),score=103.28 TRINITY_DN1537_c0_g1_i1:287-1807(-)